MKITAKEFNDLPYKAVTLIGMSGSGKTHISCLLQKWGWNNYSCDYEIGAKFLKDELGGSGVFDAEDIGALSDFLGKLGRVEDGGFDLNLFKDRQRAYYDAECQALLDMDQYIGSQNFVHDSTGSLCEVEDDNLIRRIGEKTLFIYLKTDERTEKDVLQRAQDYPKPLFFPPVFLQKSINNFLDEKGLAGVHEMVPDDFSRWVFPKLFEARKPKYQRLADLYGVTIPSREFLELQSPEQFVQVITKYLDKK